MSFLLHYNSKSTVGPEEAPGTKSHPRGYASFFIEQGESPVIWHLVVHIQSVQYMHTKESQLRATALLQLSDAGCNSPSSACLFPISQSEIPILGKFQCNLQCQLAQHLLIKHTQPPSALIFKGGSSVLNDVSDMRISFKVDTYSRSALNCDCI